MTVKVPKPYLLNIIDSVEAIKAYRPRTEQELERNGMNYDAILMRLQDIGENLAHIRDQFPEFWEQYSTDAWINAVGLRNIISHGYADIHLSIIWDVITRSIPLFEQSIRELV